MSRSTLPGRLSTSRELQKRVKGTLEITSSFSGELKREIALRIYRTICGAVASGLLMQFTGVRGHSGTIVTVLVVMIGAALLTLVAGFVNGRRLYARQL
jgi:uncharacterized membrane protein YeaQ/YmgE (transglycosylase-associated protein family)